MNLEFYLEKLHSSQEYKNFIKENSNAYLCSGFFIIDKEKGLEGDQQHLDFYMPTRLPKDTRSGERMVSFCLSDACQKKPVDVVDKENVPEKIPECDFDFEEIEKIIIEKMQEQGIKNKIQKILLSLQSKDGKCFLIGTIFLSSLGMLKVNINISEMKITNFEKKSIFDMVRRVK